MAQDVIAHGVTYNNISEVNMPLTDGGTARFFDISDTTAEASDVVEGRVIYDANGIRTVGTADPHGGLPSGGLTNEVLTKISDEDYDIDWMPAPVTSVNGKDGDVVLDASDVGAVPSDAYASTSEYGIVKLSNSVLSSSTSLAATASAVMVAYNRADAAYGEVYDVRIRANDAKSLASDAYSLALTANSIANSASSRATSALSKANSAQSTANSASSAAATARATASAALELANDAISQSSSALSLASDAISEASIAYSLASNAYALAETKVTAEEAATAAPVQSVNNQTGNITLTAADIGALPSDTALPSKMSDLDNDLGFISTEVDPTVPAWAKASAKPSYTAEEVGALPNTTAIPSKVSDLNNDLGFITTEVDPTVPTWAKAAVKPTYTASEVGALPSNTFIPSTAADVGALPSDTFIPSTAADVGALPSDTFIPSTASDVGALPSDTLYAASNAIGGPAVFANGIHYAQVDSTSTKTSYTVTIPGITEYYDGLTVMLKNGVVTSASGCTININGLGAKPIYSSMSAASADTTIFNVNYTMLFIYDSTRVSGGCWVCYRGYNSDTNTIAYIMRLNSSSLPVTGATYRYRLLFKSVDGNKLVPANTSTSTNGTAARSVNQTPIDPFGEIFYFNSTGSVAQGDYPSASTLCYAY